MKELRCRVKGQKQEKLVISSCFIGVGLSGKQETGRGDIQIVKTHSYV